MNKDDMLKIAKNYIMALVNKDVTLIPLDKKAIMTSPLAPDEIIEGKETIHKFLKEIVFEDITIVNDKVEKYVIDGDSIAILWEANCSPGNISLLFFDYLEVKDGAIVKLKSYYDPRGLLAMLKVNPGIFY